MDCHDTQAMLSAYHDGELSGADRAQVESHLRTCPDCAALLESLVRIDAAVEVPDPGPEYWESVNRGVDERVGREEARPKTPVVPHPGRRWIRQQLRYLVPAVAAAAMVVAVVRHIGLHPGSPVPSSPPPTAEADRVPPSPAMPSPAVGRDAREGSAYRASADKKRVAAPGRPAATATGAIPESGAPFVPPLPAEGKTALPPAAPAADIAHGKPERRVPTRTGIDSPAAGKNLSDVTDRQTAASAASAPSGASAETPPSGPAVGLSSGRDTSPSTDSERIMTKTRSPSDFRNQKDEAPGAAVSMMPGSARREPAARSKEDPSGRLSASPCEEARSLASRGRFKEAEAAQRACLAADASPPAQESGLVFLAELLDRQHRFAEADSVIAEAQTRFPRSRSVELYQQQRPQVQSGRIPFPSGR